MKKKGGDTEHICSNSFSANRASSSVGANQGSSIEFSRATPRYIS